MRTIIIIASFLAGGAALAVAAPDKSSSAQQQARPGAAATAPVSVPVNGQPMGAAPRSGVMALTASQCGDLGGEVTRGDDIAGQCASHAYCKVFDQKGQVHRVCLSAQ